MNVQSDAAVSPVSLALSEYISAAAARDLPPPVLLKTKHHILDTLAAILSGSRLRAGKLAAGYAARFAAVPEATVMGTALAVPAETAALANAMAAHADETDDSHLGGRFHPGCGIVPAAFAVAEQQDRSGADLKTLVDKESARLAARVNSVKDDASLATTLGYVGIGVGALALLLALVRGKQSKKAA